MLYAEEPSYVVVRREVDTSSVNGGWMDIRTN